MRKTLSGVQFLPPHMNKVLNTNTFIALSVSLTVLLSAFLLFQIQPLISKALLPWFGGASAVWSTCVLFFQVLLVLGYGYAHALSRLAYRWQLLLHGGLIFVAFFLLPILPAEHWKPAGEAVPLTAIFSILLIHVGLPYFILSATAPLIQHWYAQHLKSIKVYRLYALSNAGSMLALISFPLFVEPTLNLSQQALFWSVLFGVFAFFCFGLLLWFTVSSKVRSGGEAKAPTVFDYSGISRIKMAKWILLPLFSSVLLLSVTNHLCQDVASIPFFWVAPLTLYLLSYILCFSNARFYSRKILSSLLLVFIGVLISLDLGFVPGFNWFNIYITLPELSWYFGMELTLFLTVLFLACFFLHGELALSKPDVSHLTLFYFIVSVGGALGGILVSVVFPWLFSSYLELPAALAILYLMASYYLWPFKTLRNMTRQIGKPALLASWLGLTLVLFYSYSQKEAVSPIASARNFYGVIKVKDYDVENPLMSRRGLFHGRILHGLQLLGRGESLSLTKYYAPQSGIGVAMAHYAKKEGRRIAVMGLGAGAMAAFGKRGDHFRFYEINPQVVEFSHSQFSFLKETPAEVDIVLGDGRLSLEKEAVRGYDFIVLDAFSGDAVPIHLLTVEAFKTYKKHLLKGGILAVHVSNRHLDLSPLVNQLARHISLRAIEVYADPVGPFDTDSTWMLLTENALFLENPNVEAAAIFGRKVFPQMVAWTDEFSSLWDVYRY